MKDVTQVIKEARNKGHLLVSVELDLGRHFHRKPEEALAVGSLPYLLVYADDQALAEPNSVAASLQRYDPFNEGGEPSQPSQLLLKPESSPEFKGRTRRETTLLSDSIQNNELPEVDYRPEGYRKDELWESTWYLALKPKPRAGKKDKKRKSQEEGRGAQDKEGPLVLKDEGASQELRPDVSTVKKLKDSHMLTIGDRQKQEQRNEGKDGKRHLSV